MDRRVYMGGESALLPPIGIQGGALPLDLGFIDKG